MPANNRLKKLFTLPRLSRKPVFDFMSKRSGPFTGSVKLDRSRVYILPTRSGLIFSLLLLILLIGSINYDKSLGFALTFLLAGIGNVTLYYSWRNLAGLTLKKSACQNIFCGQTARFNILIDNRDSRPRYDIQISQNGHITDVTDIPAQTETMMQLTIESRQRGRLNAGKFRLFSEHPAGLFVAWTWLDLSMQCLVYPKPSTDTRFHISASSEGTGVNSTQAQGIDEFHHLKKFNPGENWRHICWKTAARNDQLYSKQFSGGKPHQHWINWFDIDATTIEQRLSVMTQLILDANRQQCRYGMILPDTRIEPDTGRVHFQSCLSHLALFNDKPKLSPVKP